MQGVENKTIEQKIDKNKDYITDEVEIKNFLLEDENQSQNIQELGNYLNNLQDKEYNEIKQNLEYIMTDSEIVEMFDGIRTKVGKNEKLTDDELSILYIFAVLYGKSDGFTNEGKFDLSLPIEKICNGKLLFYIQRKYQNLNYKPNYKDEGNNLTHIHKKSKNEADPWIMNKEEIDEGIKKIEREYKGLPQIPNIVDKGFIRPYCDKILKRADENGYLMKAEHESRLRNEYRTHVEYSYDEETGDVETERVYNKEFEAYVQYEKLLYAFTKYCEVINNKHEELVKKAGFFDMKEFSEEVKFLEESQELLKDKYPGLESAMERLKSYFGEIEENKKRYFSGKTDEEIEEAQKDFTKFKEFEAKKAKEDGITSETIKSISTQPESEIEVENYFKNLFKFWKYQNELNEEELKYGDNIENCQGYIEGIKIIEDKNKQSDFEMINKYMNDLNTSTYLYRPKGQEVGTSKGRLNIMDKFNKYSELLSNDPILKKDLHNISIINDVLRDPTSQDFWIFDVKNEETEKKLKQESINNRWNELYQKHPDIYEYLNIGVAARNTFINFTIGTGTSLGAMICGIIRGKEHYQSALQRKQRRDSALSFGISNEQQEPIYDPETHSINLNRKNGPYQVASSITNMVLLIYGGGEIASKIGGKFASQIGLFGMSFIQQAGQSFGEAINSGLDVGGAFAYSMLSASVQSGLELISPNEILLGKGIGLGKQLVTSLCKDGNKEGIKLAGKYFLKTMFHEIAEENLQEGLQLAAGNLINMYFNNKRNTNFEADRNPKNFLSTAIITTLTTGITTGFTAGKQGLNIANSSNQQLLQWIKSDGELYEDVMKVLNNTINGNMEIPNIDIENLKLLRGRLEGINASQEITNQNNEEEHTDNQTENQENHEERIDNNINSKKEQIIESMGSTLHEEWRQSRLQSDGTYEPRIKTTTDQERINRHNGETQVDIANTSFENLPADRKYENLEAAKVAVNLVYDILLEGQEITPEMIETLSSIVHEEWLKRNGRAKGGELDVPYSQLSEEEKAKDRRQIQQAIETVNQNNTQSQETEQGQNKKKKRNKDYFNGQSHEFNVENMQEIAIENSQYMDNALENVVNETDKGKLQELINDIKNHIEKQYEQVTGEKLNLTDDQVWSILDAHSENGSLGKLKIPELYKKVRPLIETIADKNVRRFLLEFGFCGTQENIEISNQTRNQVNQEQETQQATEQQEDLNGRKTNVERLQELGIEIPEVSRERFNEMNLDFEVLTGLKELGINISIEIVETSPFEKFDIGKLKHFQELGVEITTGNICTINRMNLEDSGIINYGKLLKIGINVYNPEILNGTEFDFQKLLKLKEFGIDVDENNIIELNGTEFDFQKLSKLKEFGININENNVIEFNGTEFDFQKLLKLKEFGVNINGYNIFALNKIESKNLQKIIEIFDEYGFIICFDINEWDTVSLTNQDSGILKNARQECMKNGIIIQYVSELNILIDIASNTFSNKKGCIERKNEFLQKNETLSAEKFNELFKDGVDEGKYGIGNIYQTDLGYCYAYTGLELLKKSNFFEALIRTSMKETVNGWEIKIPLGDPNGHIIKVGKGEIDSEYSFIAENPNADDRIIGEEYNVNVNSASILGFKILEIAFIKEYVINPTEELNDLEIIKKAKKEYETTGDITITGELLNRLEGGRTSEFMEHILGNTINTDFTNNLKNIVSILDYVNNGNIKIMLDHAVEEGKPKAVKCTLKDGRVGYLSGDHAYSIERTYIDKNTNERIIVIVDPHDTSKKLEITIDECLKVFNFAEVITININKIFAEDQENENVEQNNVERNNETGKIRDIKEIISILTGREIQTINEYDIEDCSQFNIENLNKLASICEYYGIEFFNIEDIKLFEDNIDKLLEIKQQIESLGITGLNDKTTTHFTAEIESFEKLLDLLGENLYDSQLNETYKNIRNNQEVIKLLNDEKIKVNNISELQKILNLDLNEIQGCISMKNECKSNNIILGENDVDAILLLDKIGIKKMSEYINIQKSTLGIFVLDLNNQKGINNINKYSKSLITLANLLSSKGICNIPWDDVLVQMLSETTTEQLQNIFDIEGIYKNIQDYNFDSFLYKLIIIPDEDIKNIPKIYNKIKDYCNIKIEDLNALAQIKEGDIDYNFLNLFKNKFSASELWYIFNRDIPLTENDYKILQKILDNGITINNSILKNFNKLTEQDIKNIKLLQGLGIDIQECLNIKTLTEQDIENLKMLQEMGVNLKEYLNIKLFTEQDIEKLKILNGLDIDFTNILGTKLDIKHILENIKNIPKLSNSDISKIKTINSLGVRIKFDEISTTLKMSEGDIENFKNATIELQKLGIKITEINEIKCIVDIISMQGNNIEEYIKRKNNYLEKSLTLGKEEIISGKKINKTFDKLFKEGNDKGKYGIGNIYQTDLGLCYAYTGFELLKKSNFFEVLIKTSMKETATGREVKLPLGDPNGHIIKINRTEIDKFYDFIDKKGVKRHANINSNSTLGFKILEIAFIKESFLNGPGYKTDEEIYKIAKNEYENTGDINVTGKMLSEIEGGSTSRFLRLMLGENYINQIEYNGKNENDDKKLQILNYINQGNIKIEISLDQDKSTETCKAMVDNKLRKIIFTGKHAYSIERTYINKNTGETNVIVVNPRNTSEKLHLSIDELLKVFKRWDITTININAMFKEE